MASVGNKALCINHDASTKEVNLLQVAGHVCNGNARRHVAVAMKALGLSEREDKKIRGVGKDVLVGTYDEALAIAKHLGANAETLDAIKEALRGVACGGQVGVVASDAALASSDVVDNEGEKSRPDVRPTFSTDTIDENESILDVSLARDMILGAIGSDDAFPIVFDERWSSFMGYKRHKDANDKIQKMIDRDPRLMDVHVRKEYYTNLNTGQTLQRYRFSKRGIKSFFMTACTRQGERFREYYLDLEDEYNKVVPALLDAQKTIDALRQENERLRKEKDVAHIWGRTRDESYDVQRDTMAELKNIVDTVGKDKGAPLYPVVNDALNKAVLGFPGTTSAFKKSLGIKKRELTIPDILSTEGLEERMRLSKHFFRFFRTNFGDLSTKPYDEIKDIVCKLASDNGKINSYIGDLQKELLSVEEAKKRKRDHNRVLGEARKAAAIEAAPGTSEAATLEAAPSNVVNNTNNIVVRVDTDDIARKVAKKVAADLKSQRTLDNFFKKP